MWKMCYEEKSSVLCLLCRRRLPWQLEWIKHWEDIQAAAQDQSWGGDEGEKGSLHFKRGCKTTKFLVCQDNAWRELSINSGMSCTIKGSYYYQISIFIFSIKNFLHFHQMIPSGLYAPGHNSSKLLRFWIIISCFSISSLFLLWIFCF